MLFRYLFYILLFFTVIVSLLGPFMNNNTDEEYNKTAMFIIALIQVYIFGYILL